MGLASSREAHQPSISDGWSQEGVQPQQALRAICDLADDAAATQRYGRHADRVYRETAALRDDAVAWDFLSGRREMASTALGAGGVWRAAGALRALRGRLERCGGEGGRRAPGACAGDDGAAAVAAALRLPPREARALLLEAAARGSAAACIALGRLAEAGEGRGPGARSAGAGSEEGAAAEWYRRGAVLGGAEAAHLLGHALECVPWDPAAAAECYGAAAAAGWPPSLNNLGCLLAGGAGGGGVPPAPAAAARLLRACGGGRQRGGRSGAPEALLRLGLLRLRAGAAAGAADAFERAAAAAGGVPGPAAAGALLQLARLREEAAGAAAARWEARLQTDIAAQGIAARLQRAARRSGGGGGAGGGARGLGSSGGARRPGGAQEGAPLSEDWPRPPPPGAAAALGEWAAAQALYARAAAAGSPDAQHWVGCDCWSGGGGGGGAAAVEWWAAAARQGHAGSLLALGRVAERGAAAAGLLSPPGAAAAAACYGAAAAQGCREAAEALARLRGAALGRWQSGGLGSSGGGGWRGGAGAGGAAQWLGAGNEAADEVLEDSQCANTLLLLLLLALAAGAAAAPSAALLRGPPRRLAARQQKPAPAGGGARGGGGAAADRDVLYSVVLDAGSTGSRVHLYRFRRDGQSGALALLDEDAAALQPGLSSFAGDPKAAAASLAPLMELAMKGVPPAARPGVELELKATAGLRLLPKAQADAILKEVEAYLRTFPFRMEKDAVSIMAGGSEGAYSWLTLNYLLERLKPNGAVKETVATIDLGGGSLQEAFALPRAEAAAAPEGTTTRVRAGRNAYDVYVHSYLGYGLMAARAAMIDAGKSGRHGDRRHACFAKGVAMNYTYADKVHELENVTEAGNFDACAAAAVKALNKEECAKVADGACSFNGVWRKPPPGMKRVYYISSYFWDRAEDAGIISDPDAFEWATTPSAFAEQAKKVCGKQPADVMANYPVKPFRATMFCTDLTFLYALLTSGFDLPDAGPITLVRAIEYQGKNIQASWPLGAAIDSLSSVMPAGPPPAAAKAGGGGDKAAAGAQAMLPVAPRMPVKAAPAKARAPRRALRRAAA
ncbi:MAG: nucleoside phosphatase family-domain-containing protein [Monoraphidium minutum]|nr:MAG: nucleoside phosphatase family-domain-containing protein [Monoraphidium minutum]